MNNQDKLVELIKSNPGVKVVPMVHEEIVADDSYTRWLASLGDCYLDEYIIYNDRFYYKSDISELIDDILDHNEEFGEITAEAMAEDMEWTRAIFVDINSL